MKLTKKPYSSLILMLAMSSMIIFGSTAFAAEEALTEGALPIKALRMFADIFGRIKSDYVEPISDEKLLEYAIRGMLSGLDPHSAYLDEKSFKQLQEGTSGQFGGLGIEVGMEDGFIKVISPIDDTPAQRAGLESGDLIIRLDDKSVKGMTLGDAVKMMRGTPGSPIELLVIREGVDKPLTFTIKRALIKVASIKSRMLDPGYAYVRLTQFQIRSADDMLTAIDKLSEQAGGQLKGLVLDLRNNPGGILNAAVDVSDAFLEDGLIVYTDGRIKDAKLQFNATSGDVLNGAPIVVLINNGSASASEIVAGALQDRHRAIIMGNQSFGKGSVQTVIPVSRTTAVKMTTARYYTPSGRSIQAEGIKPDIELDRVRIETAKNQPIKPLKEADLTGHLRGSDEKDSSDEPSNGESKEQKKLLSVRDYPVYEALNMLKGLQVFQRSK
ncbi:MAG: S41 family peptidase [Candidatus Polarisedimenticolaceae bacterium]|nr:S41 family peptidase [Candidatus Polarisedimenticolaceae bacterium]